MFGLRGSRGRRRPEAAGGRGAALASLALDRSWRHRRIDAVRLDNGDQGRRSVSLDCTVPDDSRLDYGEGQLAVPLARLRKGALRGFDVRDASGQPLSVLGLDDGVTLSLELLRFLIEEHDAVTYTPALDGTLRGILGPDHPDFEALFDFLDTGILDGQQVIAADEVDRLSAVTQAFIIMLTGDYFLYVLVPDVDAGRRQVLKFSWDWTPEKMSSNWWELAQAGFGTKPAVVHLDTNPGDAESYHLQVHLPAGLRAESLELLGPRETMTDDYAGGALAHVRSAWVEPTHAGTPLGAKLQMSTNDRGLSWQAMLLSVASFLFFLLSFVLDGAIDTMRDSKDSGALLLVVPAAIAVFSLGTREHPLKSQMLAAPRFAIFACSTLLILAATSLTWELRSPWFYIYWVFALIVTAASALMSVVGEMVRRRRWTLSQRLSSLQAQGG